MTANPRNFDWLNAPIYEPAPLPPGYGHTRAPMTTRFFALLCVLAVIGGVLWAINN